MTTDAVKLAPPILDLCLIVELHPFRRLVCVRTTR
jgi:hypothetical protein